MTRSDYVWLSINWGKLVIIALVLAGCTATMPVEDPRRVWCDQNSPLDLPAAAVATLDRADKERLAAYRLRGEAWCGWPPK